MENLSVIDSILTATPNYTTSYSIPTTNYYTPHYLSNILTKSYHGPTISGSHQIGVVHTNTSLAELVSQAERDLVNRAIAESSSSYTYTSTRGASTATATATATVTATATATATAATETDPDPIPTSRILKGTPFTAALRDFASERDLSVLAIATDGAPPSSQGSEMFLWALKPGLASLVPSFARHHEAGLGLGEWGGGGGGAAEGDAIVKEAGVSDGTMRVFRCERGVGAEGLLGLLREEVERA